MQNNAIITVDDLTMAYGSFVIQHDLTFTVTRGQVFVSLLTALTTISRATSGRARAVPDSARSIR